MQPAVFIARLVGPLFVLIGVGILLNQTVYDTVITEAVLSPAWIYFYGAVSLVGGLAVLNVHRAWTFDWRVVVTVLGWLMVIGGLIRILLPQVVAVIAADLYSGSASMPIVAVILLVAGCYLSFEGYRRRTHSRVI
jgi:hypothetical protein